MTKISLDDGPMRCHPRHYVLLIVMTVLVASLISQAVSSSPSNQDLFNINVNRMEKIIDEISTLGSRMTGYEGYYKTLDYLSNFFSSELGITPIKHIYQVLVPLEKETYIEILSPNRARIKAYALYPNSVNPSSTPPEGIKGKLIYVGAGKFSDFDGKKIEGNIVAMDFNSMDNWLKAANLGAKAVIFIEPDSTTYQECNAKFLDTPISFPRVYVKKADWEILKHAKEVRLVSVVQWTQINATNLVVEFKGTENPDEIVILSTHFDSWSVVPALANSRTELIPVALLMEYARYLKAHPPKYTVLIVFFSGHWQALAGAREFVEDYFFSEEVQSGKKTILGQINFDLMASDSDGLQFLHASYYTTYGGNSMHGGGFPTRLSWFMTEINNIVNKTADFIKANFGTANPTSIISIYFSPSGFWGTEPIPYMLDSEPASISGVPAFSITTRRSSRVYVGIPTSDARFADVRKIAPLLQLALYITDSLLRTEWKVDKASIKPTRFDLSAVKGYPGYATFYGKVVTYNYRKGWYDPVPNAIVEASLITSTYKLNKIIVKADEEGRFIIHGIPIAGRGASGGTTIPFSQWVVRGWIFSEDGKILMATDLGQFGMQNFPQIIVVLHPYENVTTVVAKVASLEVYDVDVPGMLTTPSLIDPRTGYFDMWRAQLAILMPFDMLTKSLPISYGYYCNGWEPVALVWVQPDLRFTVVGYTSTAQQGGQASTGGGQIFLLLTNSTEDNTEGFGYYLHYGEMLKVRFSALETAKSFYYVSYGRYSEFIAKHVGSPSADVTLKKSKEYIAKATESLRSFKYSDAYTYALIARAYAYKAYSVEVMPLVNDAARSILFMFLIIILGGFFLEKIIVHSQGPKRLIAISIFAGIFLAIYSSIHPAFGVMSNISLGLIGSLIMIILIVVVVILLSEGEDVRKSIERKVLGVHRVEVSKLDTTMIAFSLGSEYIRRRPLRAILMFITMITMIMAITSFTSLTPARVSLPVAKYGFTPTVNEILVKMGRGVPPNILSDKAITILETFASDRYYILPRAWVYGPLDRGLMTVAFVVKSSTGKNATVPAVLGITPEEFNLIYKNATLGSGILLENANHAVISKSLAQNLSVTIGDTIYIAGEEYVVTGIIDYPQAVENIIEADGFTPLPANPAFFATLSKDLTVAAQTGATPPNLGVSSVVIVPFRKALEAGGYVASVALIPKDPKSTSYDEMLKLAKELAYALDITIYVSHNGAAKQLSTFSTIAVGGWEMIVIVLVLGALNITTMVLGNLKERTREIYVFSAVGLSPIGVTVFFVAEVLVYAIVGTLIGYALGYGMTEAMVLTGAFPGGHIFNFASAFTVIGILTIILASLAAVAYPSFVASRIITPSLERRWKLKTKPRGDEWEIPLPMSVPTESEAKGILAYLHEYYTGAGAVKEGVHIVRDVNPPDYENLTLSLRVSLAPFEMGVSQTADIYSVLDRRINRYVFVLHLKRLTGPRNTWQSSNYPFVDDLRKQLLMWGSLPTQERQKYISKSKTTH